MSVLVPEPLPKPLVRTGCSASHKDEVHPFGLTLWPSREGRRSEAAARGGGSRIGAHPRGIKTLDPGDKTGDARKKGFRISYPSVTSGCRSGSIVQPLSILLVIATVSAKRSLDILR